MVNKFLVPAGFKDSLSFDSFVEHKYNNTVVEYFIDNGFTLVKPPLIEYSNNLSKNSLSILTKKNAVKLSLRDDITPQIIRIASSRLANKKRPLKLCYYREVVRKKGTILRPERQFQQIGAEIIGSDSYKADFEIINLAYESLKKIGVSNIVIEISTPFFLDKLLNKVKNSKNKTLLKKFIKLKDLDSCLKLLENNDQINNLRKIYSCSGSIKKNKSKLLNLVDSFGYNKEIEKLIKIAEMIKISKKDFINIDLFEIHEKKYYQGIRFTFFAKNIRGEIAKGGRYLLKYGQNSETAVGYTCFMDTILRASSFENKNKIILIPFNSTNKIKKDLIKKGYSIFTAFEEHIDLKQQSLNFGIKHYLDKNKVKKI